ncbi:MAG TPA: transcription antitermination factor NusB, partial [Actinomycetota bacterium]
MALDVIRRVAEHGGYSNLALRAVLDQAGMSRRDADLTTELTYGTLRRLPGLDAALEPLLRKPIATAPPSARTALRL